MTPEGMTRHLIAILSADVKDYTRLMSQDDVGTIRTLTSCKDAMRLNPYYPNWYLWLLGVAQYQAHDYEGAVKTLRKMSPIGVARRIPAASLARLGRMEEARAEAEKYLKDNPSFSASNWASTHPFLHDKDRQHAVEGFIKAGLPR